MAFDATLAERSSKLGLPSKSDIAPEVVALTIASPVSWPNTLLATAPNIMDGTLISLLASSEGDGGGVGVTFGLGRDADGAAPVLISICSWGMRLL